MKPKNSNHDSILSGITVQELIDTVQTNEKQIDEKAVRRVFDEILALQMIDARQILSDRMNEIIQQSKGGSK